MAYGDQLVDRALPAHGVGRPAGGLIVTSAWSMATVRMERRYVRACVVERTSVVGVRTGVLANWCTGDLQGHRKKLQPAETRYSTFVRELLAIYLAIKHFRHFIVGREFCVLTDHKPLTFDKYTPRQTRHLDFISQFTVDIRHVHGDANPVADALSRATVGALNMPQPPAVDFEALAQTQAIDPELKALQASPSTSLKFSSVPHLASPVRIVCDMNTGTPRPFVPTDFHRTVFNALHSLSHPGIQGTQQLLADRFVWPGINADVRSYLRERLVSSLWGPSNDHHRLGSPVCNHNSGHC